MGLCVVVDTGPTQQAGERPELCPVQCLGCIRCLAPSAVFLVGLARVCLAKPVCQRPVRQ